MVDYSNIPRDSRRVPLETRVQFKFDRFSGFLSEYSANISPGGLFIRTRTPQPLGTVLDFEFRLGDGFELIKGKGEVVWARVEDEGPARPGGMGLRFLELADGSKELIYRIVDQHVLQGGTPFDVTQRPPDPMPTPMASMAPMAPPALGGPRPAASPFPAPAPAASAPPDPFADVFELPPPISITPSTTTPSTTAPSTTAPSTTATSREQLEPLPDANSWLPSLDDPALERPPLVDPFPDLFTPAPPESAAAPAPSPLFATTFGTGMAREPRRVLPWILLAAGLVLAVGVFLLWDRLMGWAGLGGEDEIVQTAPPVRPRPRSQAARPAPEAATPASTPAPVPPPALEATPAPAPETTPAPAPAVPAPAQAVQEAAQEEAGPALTQLDRITWEEAFGGTDVILWGNGAIRPESFTRTRIEGNPPRELVRLSGIRRSFPRSRVVVGTSDVLQVRAGYHPEMGRGELHIVLDLAHPSVVVTGVEPGPHRLRIHLKRK
jgi:molecular chaperone DnaK